MILILDCLFWGTLAPPMAIMAWLLTRALLDSGCLAASPETRLKVTTPWDILIHAYVSMHSIRIVDADGEHGIFLPGLNELRGALLMNHRSWGDFVVDPAQGASAVVARLAAVAVTLLGGLTGLLSQRIIMIRRGKTSRQQLMAMCAQHKVVAGGPQHTHSPQ